MDMKNLRLQQVERAITGTVLPKRPVTGWVQAIRLALGMTTRQLAAKMGIGQSTLVALEKSEAEDRITLQSLQKAANALDCDLAYVLIPRTGLRQRVEQQAELIAHERVARVLHTMRLEDQAPTNQVERTQVEKVKATLLDSNWRQLWQ